MKAAFLLGLLNLSSGVLIVASQRQGGPSAAHPSPWVCTKGGIREASACVAAIVYQGTGGRLNNPPVNTTIQWETRKWQDPRDLHTHTHTCHSLDLGSIDLVLFVRYNEEESWWGGELLSNGSWFLNGYEEEEGYDKMYRMKAYYLTFLINNTWRKSKQTLSWSQCRHYTAVPLHD